jgi:hypothetical protein
VSLPSPLEFRPPAPAAAALSTTCLVLGAASIVGSIATWRAARGDSEESRAHAERFGIFVGLWAPTFFVLADLFGRPQARAAA